MSSSWLLSPDASCWLGVLSPSYCSFSCSLFVSPPLVESFAVFLQHFSVHTSHAVSYLKAPFCSGDIAALRALSSSHLRSFGHVTILLRELDAFTAPIYNRKVRSQIKYRRTHIARTLIYYCIVMNHN